MTVGLVGNNLLNENIRNSVSYTKDEVLMPGLGVRAFANLKFLISLVIAPGRGGVSGLFQRMRTRE